MKKWIMLGIMLIAMLVAVAAFALPVSAGTYGGMLANDLSWTLDTNTGVLIISGNGELSGDYYDNYYHYPWDIEKNTIKSVKISDGVTSIGAVAFAECTNLVSVTIPNSVTTIGYCAFYGCSSLENIDIPDSVTTIGDMVIMDTGYYNDNTHWINNVLYVGNHLIDAKESISGSYAIRQGTITISESAFNRCINLTNVVIPNSVVTIGREAFLSCQSLQSITISDSVITIGESAFVGCNNLSSVKFGNGLTEIHERAFFKCRSLTSVALPNSVTTIGKESFMYCNNLASVKIGTGTREIGYFAFANCEKLVDLKISEGITEIGNGAFYHCSGLVNVDVPDSVVTLGDSAFHGCESLSSIVIPDSVLEIGDSAFCNCGGAENLTIGSNVTKIGKEAFYYSDVTHVDIPNSVRTIDEKAFYWCLNLKSIEVSSSVITVGNWAFYSNELTKIVFNSPITEIYQSKNTISDTATIYGYDGSTAEAYAQKYGRNFVSLGTYHTCSFNQKDTSPAFQKSEATCTSPAVYYYSCTCGKKGTSTFTGDNSASHKWDDGKVTTEPTTSAEGVRTFTCTVCGATRTEAIDKLPPVTTTVPVTTEPAPETDAPVTTEPPTTEPPATETAPATTAATRPTPNSSDMDTHRGDKTASDSDDGSTLIITVLAVCLGAAVIALAVALMKKKK